ncbi:MAG: type II toxin-antitoxin system VapC family toxin [Rubrivivax sp.]|nr:type II toxin-antitoxin system VapC family toxin [Rubrivivax sp.]
MILVGTSVWVDHLRRRDNRLAAALDSALVLMHPFVIGELACGSLAYRGAVLALLQALPAAAVAQDAEALGFIERHGLHGAGIGYVDVHLLTATALSAGTRLWTRNRRLSWAAQQLGLAHADPGTH